MVTIIRLIIGLFCIGITPPRYLNEISKTIDILPVSKGQRCLCGGFLHLLPVAAGIAIMFIVRATQSRHNTAAWAALLLAGSWGLIGPALIWYYERRTLPLFLCDCRRAVKSRSSLKRIQARVYSNVFSQPICIIISVSWIILTVTCYFRVANFVSGFGVFGLQDWIWWMIFIGVLEYAYYTSLGFCFIYKTICLAKMVVVSDIDIAMYNEDGVFGFSFIGEFALRTNLMFLSGVVFVPLLLLAIQQQTTSPSYVVVATFVGIYIVSLIISFVYPIYDIHRKIVAEKSRVVKQYFLQANALIRQIELDFDIGRYYKFVYYKGVGSDICAMREWPLNIDALARFSFYAIVIPILVGVASTVLAPK